MACFACGSRRKTSRALDRMTQRERPERTPVQEHIDWYRETGLTLGVEQRTSAGAR